MIWSCDRADSKLFDELDWCVDEDVDSDEDTGADDAIICAGSFIIK